MLSNRTVRRGFTLVEMLVVTAIIAILATIVGLMNLDAEKEKDVQRGTELIQGALTQSKARALRDRRPSGIRFLRVAGGGALCPQLENIQEPSPLTDGWVTGTQGQAFLDGPTPQQMQFFDFSGAGANDTVELNGGGQKYQIRSVAGRRINLTRALSESVRMPVNGKSNYRIFRSPRPVAGDKPMILPARVAVDLSGTNSVTAPFSTTCLTLGMSGVDILFNPEGAVLTPAGADVIYLHVRDQDPKNLDVEALVAIYTRTGSVFTYPVARSSGDPYSLARQGRASNGP